jgi:small subunit ribosomal protein S8
MGLINDPIGDMLARIRNAGMARQEEVSMPTTKILVEIARVLKQEGFIRDYRLEKAQPCDHLVLRLRYGQDKKHAVLGLRRVSKPGLRVYSAAKRIPRVRNGLGVAIVSTPRGVMTGRDAYRQNVGGEVLAEVW